MKKLYITGTMLHRLLPNGAYEVSASCGQYVCESEDEARGKAFDYNLKNFPQMTISKFSMCSYSLDELKKMFGEEL